METIFMNMENRKTNEPNNFFFKFVTKTRLKKLR